VFLSLTGHSAEEESMEPGAVKAAAAAGRAA
jgi:hypothetical protein